MTLHVGIFLFDQVEALDFAGPYEVFTTATRVHARGRPEGAPLFSVCSIVMALAPVQARAGLRVLPDHTSGTHPPLDLLIVPGGVTDAPMASAASLQWIADVAATARITASVCTGAFLLARAGLLDGKPVTTHWEDIADLRAQFPALQVLSGRRWVDAGRVVTSAGISAGIDMSLHLVERLVDRALALRTARQMEFDWTPNPAPAPEHPAPI